MFLCQHYMDCLRRSIRGRCSSVEGVVIEGNIRNVIKQFRRMYRFGNRYVNFVNYKLGVPLRAIRESVVITVSDALDMEDDGLMIAEGEPMF